MLLLFVSILFFFICIIFSVLSGQLLFLLLLSLLLLSLFMKLVLREEYQERESEICGSARSCTLHSLSAVVVVLSCVSWMCVFVLSRDIVVSIHLFLFVTRSFPTVKRLSILFLCSSPLPPFSSLSHSCPLPWHAIGSLLLLPSTEQLAWSST